MELKFNEDNQVVIQDGKPVYVDSNGNDIAFDAPAAMSKIKALNNESKDRRLKADEATGSVPVIFITEKGETSDESACLEMGASDYVTKPIYPPIVKSRVKTHLALKTSMEQLQKTNRIIESHNYKKEDELDVCQQIQISMVPSDFPALSDHDEFNVYATLQPARKFGGDFYDFFFIGEDRFFFCIGDVS